MCVRLCFYEPVFNVLLHNNGSYFHINKVNETQIHIFSICILDWFAKVHKTTLFLDSYIYYILINALATINTFKKNVIISLWNMIIAFYKHA